MSIAAVDSRFESLRRLGASAPFGYAAIVLLQASAIRGIATYRDLTGGDTIFYFQGARLWTEILRGDPLWSPLYTIFYSAFLRLAGDAYIATLGHRVVLVLVLAVLALAILRRFLPPGLAWLTAAWWVVLPSHFDVVYEVYLFLAAIPLLAALLASRGDSLGRGVALAVLAAGALLVRNELSIAVLLLAAASIVRERRTLREGEERLSRVVLAYALPLAIVGLLTIAVFARSNMASDRLAAAFSDKRRIAVCQGYAFGWAERHREWSGNSWLLCRSIMQREFGTEWPSMAEALARNPRAMAEHFWWNASMIPACLQLLLFGSASGRDNPDFVPASVNSNAALLASLVCTAIVLAALGVIVRDRRLPESLGLAGLGWGWLVLGASSASCLVAMITVRPRPAYVLVLGFTLQALVAACARVLAAKSGAAARLGALVPIVAAGAILFVPRIYDAEYANIFGFRGRPLLTDYRRLVALRDRFADARARVVAPRFAYALGAYIGAAGASFLEFEPWIREKPREVDFADWLREQKITHVYADRGLLGDPKYRSFFARAERLGWHREAGGADWALFGREDGARGPRRTDQPTPP